MYSMPEAYAFDDSIHATPKSFTRAQDDFYATPPEGTLALLSVETFDDRIWEPACGDGAICKVLAKSGYKGVASDLIHRGYGHGNIDFLKETEARAKHIVTNPPYGHGLADRFVSHALKLTAKTGGKVAMLLLLSSLCHPLRHEFWLKKPPARIYGLDHLVCMPNGKRSEALERKNSERFCWVVWDPAHTGPTHFQWVSSSGLRNEAKLLS